MKAAPPDLVESYIYKPEVVDKPKPPALEKVGAAYHSEVLRVLGCLHHLTAAALGHRATFLIRSTRLRLRSRSGSHTTLPSHQRRKRRRRCATASTPSWRD